MVITWLEHFAIDRRLKFGVLFRDRYVVISGKSSDLHQVCQMGSQKPPMNLRGPLSRNLKCKRRLRSTKGINRGQTYFFRSRKPEMEAALAESFGLIQPRCLPPRKRALYSQFSELSFATARRQVMMPLHFQDAMFMCMRFPNVRLSSDRLTRVHQDPTGSNTDAQSYALDALGNMTSVTTDGSANSQTTNDANELTYTNGTAISYDDNGNMLNDASGDKYIYDAWNRLVEVTDTDGNLIEAFQYDGLGRRTSEVYVSGLDREVADLYYSSSWQIIDTYNEENAAPVRNIWSPTYVNALVATETDNSYNGTYSTRLYFTYDANFDVTAALNTSGTVQERMSYTSYGTVTFMNASWSAQIDSLGLTVLWQGGHYNSLFNGYDFQQRIYLPDLSRLQTTGVMGYVDGLNTYLSFGDNPIDRVDPGGTDDQERPGAPPLPGYPNQYHANFVGIVLVPYGTNPKLLLNFPDLLEGIENIDKIQNIGNLIKAGVGGYMDAEESVARSVGSHIGGGGNWAKD